MFEAGTHYSIFNYWRVLFRTQTYTNILYLILGFPTGLMYFLLFVIGISLGMSLMVILVGFAILLFTFILAMVGADFERGLANSLLRTDIPMRSINPRTWEDMIRDGGRALFNITTWKSIVFLGLKFPLGLASFVIALTTVATIGGLIFAPFGGDIRFGDFAFDSYLASVVASLIGVAIAPLGAHLLNTMANIWKMMAVGMLDGNDLVEADIDKLKRKDHHATIDNDVDPFYDDDEQVSYQHY